MAPSKPGLIDTHAHICDPVFDKDRVEVLEKAGKAGVVAIVAVGENHSDARKNLELAQTYPLLKPAAGLYPTILDLTQADELVGFIRQNRRDWLYLLPFQRIARSVPQIIALLQV